MFYKCFTTYMPTFKALVFKHHRKKDGTYNIKLRVIHKKNPVYNDTTYFVTDKQLNKQLEFKDRSIINIVNDLEKAYYDQSNLMGEGVNNYTAKELAEHLQRKVSANSDDSINFIAFGRQYVNRLVKDGKGSYRFEEYLRNPHSYVRKDQFGNEVKYHHEGLKNGVIDLMSCTRKLFNAAKAEYNDEDRGDIRIKYNPFGKYIVGRPQEETDKRNISPADIIKIRDCDSLRPGSRMELGRDIFMLSFYLIGMNTVDLFNAIVIKDGRVEYNRSKTTDRRKDNAFISIRIEPEAKSLIEKYRDPRGKRVFKFYDMYSNSKVFNSMLNVGLKEVAKKLGLEDMVTSYWSRHSWATIAANQCGVSDDHIGFALNHVDLRHRVTNIYIDKSWDIIDNANRKVLDVLRFKNDEEAIAEAVELLFN